MFARKCVYVFNKKFDTRLTTEILLSIMRGQFQ
jgi:hypothetical protein